MNASSNTVTATMSCKRRQVLQHPNRDERNPAHRLGETDQWNRRHQSGQCDQAIQLPADVAEGQLAAQSPENQQASSDRREQEALDGEPNHAVDRRDLSNNTVQRERHGQNDADPGELAEADGHVDDARGRDD